MSEIQAKQLVHFESHGQEYIYACEEDKEYWSVPPGTRDGLEKLLKLIRQFEREMEHLELDEATAKKFVSRYFRMRTDQIITANCLSVDVSRWCSAEERTVLRRVKRAQAKMRSLVKKPDGVVEPAK